MFKEEDENCLDMPARRDVDTDAGLEEGLGRSVVFAKDFGDARFTPAERKETADNCL